MTSTPISLATTLSQILLRKIEKGDLKIPVLPRLAVTIRNELEKEGVSFAMLARLIGQDPVLAALILQASSASAYGTSRATTLVQAVSRLGVVRLMRVVVEAMAHRIFVSKDRQIASDFRRILEHSLAVAQVSEVLAAAVVPNEADDAYLAGLMHDVGKVVVGNTLLAVEHQLGSKDREQWRSSWMEVATATAIHQTVGTALARSWQLPSSVIDAMTLDQDYDMTRPRSVVNVVHLANAAVKQAGLAAGRGDQELNDAQVMMGKLLLELDDDVLEIAVDTATQTAVSSVQAAL